MIEKKIEFDFPIDESLVSTIVYECTKHGPLNIELAKYINFTAVNEQPIVNPYKGDIPKTISALYRVINSRSTEDVCPHLFTNEGRIEPIWNYPVKYVKTMSRFSACISPDFSVYANMLRQQKRWNSFRNKYIAALWQHFGINVIPAPSWGDLNDFPYYMEGWPKHSVIAINSTGIGKDKRAQHLFLDGYYAMLDSLQPMHILRYGVKIDGEQEEISTYYPNDNGKEARYDGR